MKRVFRGGTREERLSDALTKTNIDLESNECLLLMTPTHCGTRNFTPWKFTLFDPDSGKQWDYVIHANEGGGALRKYMKYLQEISEKQKEIPETRTGVELKDPTIKRLLEYKERDRDIKIYLTKASFINKSSDLSGTFKAHYGKKIIVDIYGEERELKLDEFYAIKIADVDYFSVPTYDVIVFAIGFKEKFFFLNAVTELNKLEKSEDSYILGTYSSDRYLHFVSDSANGEIISLHDIEEKDRSDGIQSIFDCMEELESNPSRLVPNQVKCVQFFLDQKSSDIVNLEITEVRDMLGLNIPKDFKLEAVTEAHINYSGYLKGVNFPFVISLQSEDVKVKSENFEEMAESIIDALDGSSPDSFDYNGRRYFSTESETSNSTRTYLLTLVDERIVLLLFDFPKTTSEQKVQSIIDSFFYDKRTTKD